MLGDDRVQCGSPDARVVVAEPLVVRDDDAIGSATRELIGHVDAVAEDERDVVAAELPGKLPALRNELQRVARDAAVRELHARPAVVALGRRGVAEPLRLVPLGRRRRAPRRQLTHARDRLVQIREPLAGAVGCHVAHGEHPCR